MTTQRLEGKRVEERVGEGERKRKSTLMWERKRESAHARGRERERAHACGRGRERAHARGREKEREREHTHAGEEEREGTRTRERKRALLYNVESFSAVQQSESAGHIYPLPVKPASQYPHLTPPGHQRRAEPPVPYSSFPLAIYFTTVMCTCQS